MVFLLKDDKTNWIWHITCAPTSQTEAVYREGSGPDVHPLAGWHPRLHTSHRRLGTSVRHHSPRGYVIYVYLFLNKIILYTISRILYWPIWSASFTTLMVNRNCLHITGQLRDRNRTIIFRPSGYPMGTKWIKDLMHRPLHDICIQ